MANIFLSGPFDYKGKGWGYAHYSYGFALDSFKAIAEKSDNIVDIFSYPFSMPEINSKIKAASNPIHISFLPPDVALIIPGAFNICVFAWEFDKLPKQSKEKNGIFKKDYAKALKKFDAVITLSTYAQETLASYNIKSYVLPSATIQPPNIEDESIDDLICYPLTTKKDYYKRPGIAKTLKDIFDYSPYEERFLYILNPHDIRKNFGNLTTAFSKFVEEHPNATLILKMTSQGDLTKLQETAFRREFPLFDNTMFNNVYFIPEKLSDKELHALMQSCETYISPSRAEGQNLPLCEAMHSSRITIAPDHTSMKDFINTNSTILLDHHPWTIDKTTHKYYDFWGFNWYSVPEDTILNALNKKMSLTNGQKRFIIDKAKQNVENFSSESSVLKKWNGIKEDLKL